MPGVRDANLEPKGYGTVTTMSTAKSLPTIPTGARFALLKVETKAVRWRDDGVDPTGTTGTPIDVGDEFWYTGKLSKVRVIEDGATATATLHVTYYG